MMEELLDYVLHEIRAVRSKIEQDLGRGVARNYDEYQMFVGKIRGLSQSEDVLRDTYKRLTHEMGEEATVVGD